MYVRVCIYIYIYISYNNYIRSITYSVLCYIILIAVGGDAGVRIRAAPFRAGH